MGIIAKQNPKQILTIYIGEVLTRRVRASLTGSIYPMGKIGVVTN